MDTFEEFLRACKKAGYEEGMRVSRKDINGPYSEDNLVCVTPPDKNDVDEERAAKWDAVVIPLREQFKNELERLAEEEKERSVVHVWQYEHPDRIREMRGGKA